MKDGKRLRTVETYEYTILVYRIKCFKSDHYNFRQLCVLKDQNQLHQVLKLEHTIPQ